MSVLLLHHITDTTLYKHLQNGFRGSDAVIANGLAAGVLSVCEEAAKRMKAFPAAHPQYTLHDEVHLLRVTELMAKVLGEEGTSVLNPIEIALLILAAHLHDQGMVLDEAEFVALEKDANYIMFSKNWVIEHQTLGEVRAMLSHGERGIDELAKLRHTENELMAALYTDYVRTTHGVRSATYILTRYGNDERLKVSGINIAPFVARLAASHVKSAALLNENNGFYLDESIGEYTINMVYLGLILRIADILDFDRDRTPDSLYRSIHFTSPVSLLEWEKHRAVTGWVIEPAMIRFTAHCEHPEYERAIRHFMDWIDDELAACRTRVQSFPKAFERYQLKLPVAVNRERIGPKDGAYIYHDLEFSLSRDQIVKLLMTDKLYGSSDLCIRELLQNALDALRLRRAMMLRDSESVWNKGEIKFEHFLDEHGYEIVRCTDNGAGMDIDIITRFLTNVGRSYYRSPEFEQERLSLQQADADFEPIGQFGIGFMSCFMLGDKIKISTRKDYGQSLAHGPSLSVEINGMGGIVSIRELDMSLPIGTTVEINCGKFKGLLHNFHTKARVVNAVSTVAIATEFPISVVCTIPENLEKVNISVNIEEISTPFERSEIKNIITPRFDFSNLSSLLQGSLKESFLLDSDGNICIENEEAFIEPADVNFDKTRRNQFARLVFRGKGGNADYNTQRIAFDGIYVCGDSGHSPIERYYRGSIEHGMVIHTGRTTFTMNVRGNLKAALTPARGPINSHRGGYISSDWSKLEKFVRLAQASTYDSLIANEFGSVSPDVYWKLMVFNGLDIEFLNLQKAWQNMALPFIDPKSENALGWIPINSLGPLHFEHYLDGRISTEEGLICVWPDSRLWGRANDNSQVNQLTTLLLAFCAIDLSSGKLTAVPRKPEHPSAVARDFVFKFNNSDYSAFIAIPYTGELYDCLIFPGSIRTVNENHPVVKYLLARTGEVEESYLISFFIELLHTSMFDYNGFVSIIAGENEVELAAQRLGLLFGLVNWENFPSDLQPPYKLYMRGGKVVLEAKNFIFLRDNGPSKSVLF